jgi:hypothetical protein
MRLDHLPQEDRRAVRWPQRRRAYRARNGCAIVLSGSAAPAVPPRRARACSPGLTRRFRRQGRGRVLEDRELVGIFARRFPEGGGDLPPAGDTELRPQGVGVRLCCSWRNAEPIGDLQVRASPGDEVDDLALAEREAFPFGNEHGGHRVRRHVAAQLVRGRILRRYSAGCTASWRRRPARSTEPTASIGTRTSPPGPSTISPNG